jgi:predicted MPP superfamily phosphohydrolase
MIKILSEPLSIESLNAKINGLPKSLQNTKIVQLSDFHYDGLLLA